MYSRSFTGACILYVLLNIGDSPGLEEVESVGMVDDSCIFPPLNRETFNDEAEEDSDDDDDELDDSSSDSSTSSSTDASSDDDNHDEVEGESMERLVAHDPANIVEKFKAWTRAATVQDPELMGCYQFHLLVDDAKAIVVEARPQRSTDSPLSLAILVELRDQRVDKCVGHLLVFNDMSLKSEVFWCEFDDIEHVMKRKLILENETNVHDDLDVVLRGCWNDWNHNWTYGELKSLDFDALMQKYKQESIVEEANAELVEATKANTDEENDAAIMEANFGSAAKNKKKKNNSKKRKGKAAGTNNEGGELTPDQKVTPVTLAAAIKALNKPSVSLFYFILFYLFLV